MSERLPNPVSSSVLAQHPSPDAERERAVPVRPPQVRRPRPAMRAPHRFPIDLVWVALALALVVCWLVVGRVLLAVT
jgi:hypothetical protein